MDAHYTRAKILIRQNRFKQAEEELRKTLRQYPKFGLAHILLAFCLNLQKKEDEALQEVEMALQLDANNPHIHYVSASIYKDQDNLEKAQTFIKSAIRLNPNKPDYFFLLGSIYLIQNELSKARDAVEQGIQIDPNHIECQNLRAGLLALEKNTLESKAILQANLSRDPNNARTHFTQGWIYFEAHDYEQALTHFRETLRLNPNFEEARVGFIKTLKWRYKIYQFIGHLLGGLLKERWVLGIILLSSIFIRGLPFLFLFLILYFFMAFDNLFNLMFYLDKSNRLYLSTHESVAARWTGGSLLVALLSLLIWVLTGHIGALFSCIYAIFMSTVIGCTFRFDAETLGHKMLYSYLVALGGVGALGMGFLAFDRGTPNELATYSFVGLLIYVFISFRIIQLGQVETK